MFQEFLLSLPNKKGTNQKPVFRLARYSSAAGVSHLDQLQTTLRYIKGTVDVCLPFPYSDKNQFRIVGLSDSDHCYELERMSRHGYDTLAEGNPIDWASKTLPEITLSSCAS